MIKVLRNILVRYARRVIQQMLLEDDRTILVSIFDIVEEVGEGLISNGAITNRLREVDRITRSFVSMVSVWIC